MVTSFIKKNISLFYSCLIVIILLVGAYLRFNGLFWGEYQYLHPDERFLVWVGTDISPVEKLSDYWDTVNSSLNPHNRGHGFYVYGTLPMFLARYVVEWVYGHSGFNEMTDVGRILSALFDLGAVLLVFLVARVVYDWRVGLLASAFSALAVLQIQHAHFFTMDTFTTFFAILTIYFAVRVAYEGKVSGDQLLGKNGNHTHPAMVTSTETDVNPSFIETNSSISDSIKRLIGNPLFSLSLGFGVALGMAVASKVNAAPLALLLPLALLIRSNDLEDGQPGRDIQRALIFLVLAGAVSFLTFRIFQPYAFGGPGFLGIRPNPAWMANLNELRNQASGDVDFPPALQWARRPVWFSWQNMVLWGLGLPLGLLAWAGFLWAGWRILNGEWRRHILLWGWTAFYFTWQSLIFNPSMRYQLLVYPTLVIFGAWGVVRLYDHGRSAIDKVPKTNDEGKPSAIRRSSFVWGGWVSLLAILIGGFVLFTTAVYAFAFSSIYARPITRIAASRWIYQNIPGPINLPIQTNQGVYNQPVPFPYDYLITQTVPYAGAFTAAETGEVSAVHLGTVINPQGNYGEKEFLLTISESPTGGQTATARLTVDLPPNTPEAIQQYAFTVETPFQFNLGQDYYLDLRLADGQGPLNVSGSLDLMIQGEDITDQSLPLENAVVDLADPYSTSFTAQTNGFLVGVNLNLLNQVVPLGEGKLNLTVSSQPNGENPLASASFKGNFGENGRLNSSNPILILNKSIDVEKGQTYYLMIGYAGPESGVTIKGTAIANEGAWDDGLPVRLDGYDGFGGVYPPGLNFDMYEDDNPNKLARFYNILDQAEYLLISSNRQWGSLPRLPERFPMTSEYYRHLLGCPPERNIDLCYNLAKPGDFKGDLGFDLVEVFQSDPTLGPWSVYDQFAEEAFTVYDHPKVFVFHKRPDYNPGEVRAILGAVDLSKVVHITPRKAGSLPKDMMLPRAQFILQQASGTWSDLFNTQAWLNRWPGLGLIAWYLMVALLGWVAYPIVRYAMPGLADGGFPLARTAGLLILSYLVWLASSLRLPFNRLTITICFALMVGISLLLVSRQREELRSEWQGKRRYFLMIEGLFLAFFVFDLLIRLGNPDLWHPWKGGEKPMDFSYFNAILKSTNFPPYDPWFAGGYINYYYYGFVLVGVLVKWLGIVPSIAYNLIIPTIFSLIALGAFSIAWNLTRQAKAGRMRDEESSEKRLSLQPSAFISGIAAALGMAVLGNLGTLRMIVHGYQRLAAPGGVIDGAGLIPRLVWTIKGGLTTLLGTPLPYGLPDWYWIPSRAIPAPNEVEPITEFPFFTVLYGDPHAHLFAMPLALLAIAWGVSVVLGQAWKPQEERSSRRSILQVSIGLVFGGLVIGSLRPTNTWDFPTYLALGLLALGYAIWKDFRSDGKTEGNFSRLSPNTRRTIFLVTGLILLGGLAFLLYQPYAKWYVQGYTAIEVWKGTKTPFWSYLTHWGVFLFLIVSWMVWETRDWMASTLLSEVRKLDPYRSLIGGGLILLLAWVVVLLLLDVSIAWLVLPLAAWAGILMFRPGISDSKRIVILMVESGLLLTLMVELIVLKGDIARMNTVFKFYLQVWTLFSISAAVALGWLLAALPGWSPSWRSGWQIVLFFLVASSALYPLLGATAKIKDRMVPDAPHTLDGMAYMKYATYDDLNTIMDLSLDYDAIRWVQENVNGSPVILEGNMVEYHWADRFSIYTGLPNVIGWNWHQRQQRGTAAENLIPDRISGVNEFYLTTDPSQAKMFLDRYGVQYIILGQLERALYPGQGLDKFEQLDGSLWREVYRDGETVIYQVASTQ